MCFLCCFVSFWSIFRKFLTSFCAAVPFFFHAQHIVTNHCALVCIACYTLKRNTTMSPSWNTYSLPSTCILPASFTAASLP